MPNESFTNCQKEKEGPCFLPGARTVSPGGLLNLSFFLQFAHNSITSQPGHKCLSNGTFLGESLWMCACEGGGERNNFLNIIYG